jgi:gliding motility-associated transport system ATP-binding protein
MPSLLEVSGLARHYGGHPALAGVDLALEPGTVLGLLGPNGAGKTTCLQVLSGNLAPSAGQVKICGIDLARHPLKAKRHLGYLPERPPLYPEMRVDEYLELCARLHRVPSRQVAAAVRRVKARCSLEDVGRRLLAKLSRGYRQRLGLAQAIVHEPDLVILDEPTEGLDPEQIREVRLLIRELAAHCGVILSSHILPEVQAVCTQVLILRNGRPVHQGPLAPQLEQHRSGAFRVRLDRPPPSEVLLQLPAVSTVLAGDDGVLRIDLAPGLPPSALARSLVEGGWGLRELTPERTDLERIYFETLGLELVLPPGAPDPILEPSATLNPSGGAA